jgi:hypothetical protein
LTFVKREGYFVRKILISLCATVFVAGPAAADTILLEDVGKTGTTLVEDFEKEFPAWEKDWLGLNSNLQNYYGVGAGRGNNPDGLWISDGDSDQWEYDQDVTILFDKAFGASLYAFSIDIAGWVPGTFSVFDSFGQTLLSADVPLTYGALTDPGKYGSFAVKSATGIGGFSFWSKEGNIEGNTSIDNVTVSTGGRPIPTPEPSSLILFGVGIAGVLARRRGTRRPA